MVRKKNLKILIIAFFIIIINITVSEAAISASSVTVNSGEKVQISVSSNIAVTSYKLTMTNSGGLTFITSSGGVGEGTATITDASATGKTSLGTFTFQAPSVTVDTTYKVSFSATIMEDTSDDPKPIPDSSTTATITVKAPVVEPPPPPPSTNTGSGSSGNTGTSSNNSRPSNNTRPTETTPTESSNSKLASLAITEGVITPEFNSDVTEYSISVPNEITVLNISATAEDSAAEVEIVGNEELKVGENNIQIIVTAEDGSTTTYNILATRADEQLSLQSLSIYYIDENGQKVELKLNPIFALNVYEYNILEKLPSTVNKLEVEAIASKENAKIEITGNEELKSGQNEISIKVTLTDEAGLEEQKTYKIILEKEEEPVGALTFWEKMSRWFNGAGITISTWFSQNLQKIIIGMLIVATVTFMGLTVYFVYDYKNYKKLLSKLAEYNKENLMERASTALNPEMAENNEDDNIENNLENNTDINKEDNANNNIVEQIFNAENPETGENVQEITEKPKAKLGKGKRFK